MWPITRAAVSSSLLLLALAAVPAAVAQSPATGQGLLARLAFDAGWNRGAAVITHRPYSSGPVTLALQALGPGGAASGAETDVAGDLVPDPAPFSGAGEAVAFDRA